MHEPDEVTDPTYLLEVREGSAPAVESTVEKYYGALIESLSGAAESGTAVRFSTSHELPIDAFRRITEVERATRIHCTCDAPASESIAEACCAVLTTTSHESEIALAVRAWNVEPSLESKIERSCRSAVNDPGCRIVDADDSVTEIRVLILRDWVGFSVGDPTVA